MRHPKILQLFVSGCHRHDIVRKSLRCTECVHQNPLPCEDLCAPLQKKKTSQLWNVKEIRCTKWKFSPTMVRHTSQPRYQPVHAVRTLQTEDQPRVCASTQRITEKEEKDRASTYNLSRNRSFKACRNHTGRQRTNTSKESGEKTLEKLIRVVGQRLRVEVGGRRPWESGTKKYVPGEQQR